MYDIEALSLPRDMLNTNYAMRISISLVDVKNVNLNLIETLKKINIKPMLDFLQISGIIVPAVATSMGATVIENACNIGQNYHQKITDQPGSLEEQGLKKLIQYVKTIQLAI